ncbi:MAG: transcriptional activator NhaR [Bryobacteraceae bacterium]|nr:transcriptional activator NhaR [Bryobacteraceae bacterium]
MDWINYHHLLYFRTVAREGSITRASKLLALAQPTISGQIRALEETLGEKLFARQGRNLVLTEFGRVVYRYADEIFSLGQEMTDVLRGRPSGRPHRLSVGISAPLSKLVVSRILAPATELAEPVQLVCHEDKTESLISSLQMHGLDLVLTDTPITPTGRVKVYNHLLGASGLSVFALPDLAARYRKKFPQSLDQAPMLLPLENSSLRRCIDQWMIEHSIRPRIVGESQDSALLKTLGASGAGLFFAPTVVEKEVRNAYRLSVVGRVPEIVGRFYAVSVERRFANPAIAAILESARQKLFVTPENQDEAA